VRKKGKRIGRNPKTGEEVPINPRRVLIFRASHVLKDQINVTLAKSRPAKTNAGLIGPVTVGAMPMVEDVDPESGGRRNRLRPFARSARSRRSSRCRSTCCAFWDRNFPRSSR